MKNQYETICKKIDQITECERKDIAELYLKYYAGSSAEQVEHDLLNKTEIILMISEGEIVGFTTLEIYEKEWNKKPIRVIYSGDTIIDKAHWGQQALTFACITRMGLYKNIKPNMPTYWFLIVKGHRTFKYLPVFMKHFYPHWEYQSNTLKSIAEFLVKDKFGELYNINTGVIEFPQSKGHLNEEFANPNSNEINKPSGR